MSNSRVKSLILNPSRVRWAPVSYDAEAVNNLIKGYSYRELQRMAKSLALDPGVSKGRLAICVNTETLIFFPEEAGRYAFETLVLMVNRLNLNPQKENLYKSTKSELQRLLIDAWKGGSASEMQVHFNETLDLYHVMQSLEDQFCSGHIKELLHHNSASSKNPSLYHQIDSYLKQVHAAYNAFSLTKDEGVRRQHFIKAQAAIAQAQRGVIEYLRLIREHCQHSTKGSCDVTQMPEATRAWFRTATAAEKFVLCNVTVEGSMVPFRLGEKLLTNFHIAHVSTHPTTRVQWVGLEGAAQTSGDSAPAIPPRRVTKELFVQGQASFPLHSKNSSNLLGTEWTDWAQTGHLKAATDSSLEWQPVNPVVPLTEALQQLIK